MVKKVSQPPDAAPARSDGKCPRGLHGLDYKGQVCDLCPPSESYPNPKVNGLVYSSVTDSFKAEDWMDLARAALDQAGISNRHWERMLEMMPQPFGARYERARRRTR